MPDRRHFRGHSDISGLILGLGEAIDPTSANPYYGVKPGDIPFERGTPGFQEDPESFLKKQHSDQPFKGFQSGAENLEAAHARIALQERTKADQIRRTQAIAEQEAAAARERERLKTEGIKAILDFNNASGVTNTVPLTQAEPGVAERTLGMPRLAATLGAAPYVRDTAAAEGRRGLQEARSHAEAAESDPKRLAASYGAGYDRPVLANDAARQEIAMHKAQEYAWPYHPMHPGLTMTGPYSGISVNEPTKEAPGAKYDEKGNVIGYGIVPGKPAIPTPVVIGKDGMAFTKDPPPPAKNLPPPPGSAALTPSSGPGIFTPPNSLKPSAFNPNPIQARGALPSLLNNFNAYANRGDIEQQTSDEVVRGDPLRGAKDAGEFWWGGPGYYPPAPVILHSPLPLPPDVESAKKKRRLQPSY